MDVKEKRHRLPKECYRGKISIVFTLCLKGDAQAFISHEIINIFTDILTSAITKEGCIVPVYCFMPDHQHLIIKGMCGSSDVWETVVRYKQKTGFWMSVNKPGMKWQKDFYDHIIRRESDIVTQVRYILDNPVRKGLVSSWHEYPFKGSIGCEIENVFRII